MTSVHLETPTATVTIEKPSTDTGQSTGTEQWIVTVFDNDVNTIDEVMAILMIATKCTADEAYMETWEVHNLGKSVVHHGSQEDCEAVAEVISTIGIRVEVSEE
jgi:ATP-dependent Clp protease adapter protein ClpS